MTGLLFPLWQIDQQEYRAICAYLGITPKTQLYDRLSDYLARASFHFGRPQGFSRFLATPRLTRFRIGRLDLATKLFFPDHPVRHVLNGVIALYECDGEGYAQMAALPGGWRGALSIFKWALDFALNLAISIPWLVLQLLIYIAGTPFRLKENLEGLRVLITGVNRGLGRDLMLHCLEGGADVVGTVRSRESLNNLKAQLPAEAPVTLLVADLSRPEAIVDALLEARIPADSIHLAILCAGVKYSRTSVLSLPSLRDTFQVNFFSAVAFAAWLCKPGRPDRTLTCSLAGAVGNAVEQRGKSYVHAAPLDSESDGQRPAKTAVVLISSMGRWHGMPFSAGYNASKAALSIWGESLDMELRRAIGRQFTVTIVEAGIFDSRMTDRKRVTRILLAPRRRVAARVISGALAGKRTIRPPFWFAILTWGVCLFGRNFRYRLFARAKVSEEGP